MFYRINGSASTYCLSYSNGCLTTWSSGLGTGHYYYNAYYTGSYIQPQAIIEKPKPIFSVNDFIVYLHYFKWSKKLAIHHIIDISETGYIIKSSYPENDNFEITFDKNDDFMELKQCLNEYPDLFLSIKEINGYEKDLGKIIEDYNRIKNVV